DQPVRRGVLDHAGQPRIAVAAQHRFGAWIAHALRIGQRRGDLNYFDEMPASALRLDSCWVRKLEVCCSWPISVSSAVNCLRYMSSSALMRASSRSRCFWMSLSVALAPSMRACMAPLADR